MPFIEQLLLNELAGSGLSYVLIVGVFYLFYLHLRNTIDNQREDNKEMRLDSLGKLSEIETQILLLNANIANFSQNFNDIIGDLAQSTQAFTSDMSRNLNELIRVSDQLRDICKKNSNVTTGGNINVEE